MSPIYTLAQSKLLLGEGSRLGELLHPATIAIICEIPLERLWHAVPSFPTMSEIWLRLLENMDCDEVCFYLYRDYQQASKESVKEIKPQVKLKSMILNLEQN